MFGIVSICLIVEILILICKSRFLSYILKLTAISQNEVQKTYSLILKGGQVRNSLRVKTNAIKT